MGPAKRILLWGGGGHGKVVADLVRALGARVVGFVDRDAAKLGLEVEPGGGSVLSLEADFLAHIESCGTIPFAADAVALCIGDNAARLAAFRALRAIAAPALVHPSAVASPSARIGRASVVCPGATINAGATVSDAVIINSRAVVEHDCAIGEAAHISPGAVLAGGVTIGSQSWVGAGAIVLPGVAIGSAAIIGAGAVVLHDVPSGAMVVGNPARLIEQRS